MPASGAGYSLRVKKRLLVLVTLLSLIWQGSAVAHADGALPQADVTCSITATGVQFGTSMKFTSGTTTIGTLSYDWEYAILTPGADPATSTSYSSRKPLYSTTTNGTSLTYDQLLILAGNKSDAVLSVFATVKNANAGSITTNSSGMGCFADLRVVKKGIDDLATQVKDAEAKAAADKKAAEQAAIDAQKVQDDFVVKLADFKDVKASIDNLLSGKSPFFTLNATLTTSLLRADKYSIPAFPRSKADLDALTLLLDGDGTTPGLNQDLDTAIDGIDAYTAQMQAAAAAALAKASASKKVTTITCIKGKVTKKVKGVKPKCPTGYRLKK